MWLEGIGMVRLLIFKPSPRGTGFDKIWTIRRVAVEAVIFIYLFIFCTCEFSISIPILLGFVLDIFTLNLYLWPLLFLHSSLTYLRAKRSWRSDCFAFSGIWCHLLETWKYVLEVFRYLNTSTSTEIIASQKEAHTLLLLIISRTMFMAGIDIRNRATQKQI